MALTQWTVERVEAALQGGMRVIIVAPQGRIKAMREFPDFTTVEFLPDEPLKTRPTSIIFDDLPWSG